MLIKKMFFFVKIVEKRIFLKPVLFDKKIWDPFKKKIGMGFSLIGNAYSFKAVVLRREINEKTVLNLFMIFLNLFIYYTILKNPLHKQKQSFLNPCKWNEIET